MQKYRSPGVYKEDIFPVPAAEFLTGVPVFLGLAEQGDMNSVVKLTHWQQFEESFGKAMSGSYLAYAVRGFFENGGSVCYVVRLDNSSMSELDRGLKLQAFVEEIDLVCTPDIMTNLFDAYRLQKRVLDHCDKSGDRFAILDSIPDANSDKVLEQREKLSDAKNGALYYPWLLVQGGSKEEFVSVPPSGHVAGVYARTDMHKGVFKAPANEILKGVLDTETEITNLEQDKLNPESVNCIRTFKGRGIRVWGARTLVGEYEAEWLYINVRRLFLTVGRWIERNMQNIIYEPNDFRLWSRIIRELTAYFNNLFKQGALKGGAPSDAFYIKCDAETNPPEVRDKGMIVTEVGLKPVTASEFVIIRIIHGDSGVTINGVAEPL
jgi:phage tail sheath protein FI